MSKLLRVIIPFVIFFGIITSVFLYSFNRCGWGVFAYEYPIIAAVTGECAKQQRLQQAEEAK
jgi:hypothetical protein